MLGDGDGRFLANFLERNRTAQVLATDTSAGMLGLLRKRCLARNAGAEERLRTLQVSALEVLPARKTDLVVSHFVLDCLTHEELRELTQLLAGRLPIGTRWLISDFDLPSSLWLRILARVHLRSLYGAFRLLTGLRVSSLPPIAEALHEAGFLRIRRVEFAAGMLYTEMWQLGERKMHSRRTAAFSYGDKFPMDQHTAHDPQPDPEPPVPSLPEPDPGVFHHTPAVPAKPAAPSIPSSEEQIRA